jgi:biopolymer transport protein ExbD
VTFNEPAGEALRSGPAVAVILGSSALNVILLATVGLGWMPSEWRREREVPLELVAAAEGTAPRRLAAREVIIHVGPTGEIRLGGRAIEFEALKRKLASLAALTGETSAAVRADARAPYGVVARILAASRHAGIRSASLLTVNPPASLAPPAARGGAPAE